MKGVIGDYFGQSPIGNGNAATEETAVHDNAVSDGKENKKAKRKMSNSKLPKGKPKTSTKKGSPHVNKVSNNKSSSTKKHKLENTAPVNTKDEDGGESPVLPNFSLRIRMKSKDQEEDKDNFIDDLSSPDHIESKCKDLKSPKGLLKYLVSPKNSPAVGKDGSSATQSKAIRDITDYFSSPKGTSSKTISGSLAVEERNKVDQKTADNTKNSTTNAPLGKKAINGKEETAKSRSTKKSKGNAVSCSKKNETEDSSDKMEVVKPSSLTAKNTSKPKAKSAKRSLSLTKKETVQRAEESPVCPEGASLPDSKPQESSVAKSMNSAFQAIMSKSSLNRTDLPQTVPDMFSKKRKRENDDDINADKPCKTVKEDSPVRVKKRYSNSNQIESDSDNDVSSTANIKSGEELSNIPQIDNHVETEDCPLKSEDSKRNSLMSYFSKVTKEEALAKEDKIEMKVQAMVHSPPTTPSKKTKRRSVNSLPGGALSFSKKKINVKAKLKENINAIDVMDVEEPKMIDVKNKDSSRVTSKKQTSPSSKSIKHSMKSLTSSLKTDEPSSSKEDTSKSVKKSLSRGKGKQEIKTKLESDIDSAKPMGNTVVDEECLAVPLPAVDAATIENPQTPSDSKTLWKMRVCLTPISMPSSQGTMLEEESDTEEIFLQRKDKKRKLSKQSVSEKTVGKDEEVFLEDKSQSPDVVFEKETKQSPKIAPLFTRKAVSQARQQFLQSGVPDQVKRNLETQRSCEEQETELFPRESHIQQRDNEDWSWNLPDVELPIKADCFEDIPQISSKFSLSDVTGCSDIIEELKHVVTASCKGPVMRPMFGFPLDIMKPILRLIKLGSPELKVVNTFKVLRSKLREEEFAKAAALSEMPEMEKPKRKSSNRKSISSKQAQPMATYRARCWTEKYKPCTASDIVGNGASIQQLKRWLESWRKASEDSSNKSSFCKEEVKRKKKRKAIDDDDDFVVSDNSSDATQNNFPVGVAVLCGPNGSGKTSSVYALAKDLGYKVLEVNASEKRNGKLVLSKLSEATQSHQVQQGPTAEQGFAALFAKNSGKKKMPVKVPKSGNDVEDDKTKKMSLILFEDVDIVFEEEDEGFLSAISTLVSTSKRPVILTTTDPESAMVQRFMNSSSVILPFSCPSNLITIWLQIVSLLEGVYVAPATVKDLVSLCKGDFRRAILQMQLWVTSGGNNLPMPSITYAQPGRKSKKSSKKDENDDMSDMEGDSSNHDSVPSIPPNPDCISPMLGKNYISENTNKSALQVDVPFPLDAGLFWWNIPSVLSLKQLKHAELPVIKEDPSAPPLGAGVKRMLDDSFIASFCSDDASTTDSGLNDDSDAQCSQATSASNSEATSVGDVGDCQDTQNCCLDPSQSSVGPVPIPYTSACSQEEMVALYKPLMALSFIDIIGHSSQLNISSNMEPITRFCNPVMKDSLSLTKLDVDGPNSVLNSTAQDISHWLAEQSLNQAKSCFCPENICQYSYCLPDEDEYKWRAAHVETEQVALQAVPLSAALERRALYMDYMPTLRIFCRLERNRSSINTKRRNRFFHYLKTLGAHPDEAQLELLCRSMYGC
ncbi:ATPase family AAA domain-containing protein 5 isoform X3 [Thrips palmi]|uniref:ATPase family AAA domain-containing protein 5 isoform X3 n=1 Tax=Thrips palmi TaxID=161013 RepID=A0A6P8ZU48_THRPL|nr:ATPase family AAA domain-containing protein 5 isoform X3 [Thrips palmi]